MGIGTDCIVSCKSNYHLITTAPKLCNTVSIKQKYTIDNVHAKKLKNKSFAEEVLQSLIILTLPVFMGVRLSHLYSFLFYLSSFCVCVLPAGSSIHDCSFGFI